MSKLIAAPISRNEIRNFTREFRKIIGLDNKLHIDIIRILEHVLPSVFPDMEYMYVPVEEMSGIHGFTTPMNQSIIIRVVNRYPKIAEIALDDPLLTCLPHNCFPA